MLGLVFKEKPQVAISANHLRAQEVDDGLPCEIVGGAIRQVGQANRERALERRARQLVGVAAGNGARVPEALRDVPHDGPTGELQAGPGSCHNEGPAVLHGRCHGPGQLQANDEALPNLDLRLIRGVRCLEARGPLVLEPSVLAGLNAR